jgi:hypothetical protein
MDHQLKKSLERAAHVALHTQTGKDAIKAVGSTVIGVAAPLLATPAAPIVIGAAAIGGVCIVAKKIAERLNS